MKIDAGFWWRTLLMLAVDFLMMTVMAWVMDDGECKGC